MPTPATLRRLRNDHPIAKLMSGLTPSFASTIDQRFSFQLQLPSSHTFTGPALPVLVVIHGTRRQTLSYLESLKPFSNTHNIAILTPLFPAGIIDPADINNYKNLIYNDIRFDLILLSMLEQAAEMWRVRADKFFLHGFSGGGQFAHRFMYVHPDRLLGVSIGAPGRFTPPDTSKPWPEGLSDLSTHFSLPASSPDFKTMSHIPIQLLVGANDVDPSLLRTIKHPTAAEQDAGESRVERIEYLMHALEERGIMTELTTVPGVAHDGIKCVPALEAWLAPLVDALYVHEHKHEHKHMR